MNDFSQSIKVLNQLNKQQGNVLESRVEREADQFEQSTMHTLKMLQDMRGASTSQLLRAEDLAKLNSGAMEYNLSQAGEFTLALSQAAQARDAAVLQAQRQAAQPRYHPTPPPWGLLHLLSPMGSVPSSFPQMKLKPPDVEGSWARQR